MRRHDTKETSPFMTDPKQPEPEEKPPLDPTEKPPVAEPGPAPAPEKLRLEPTRYGDWELNGKCVDF